MNRSGTIPKGNLDLSLDETKKREALEEKRQRLSNSLQQASTHYTEKNFKLALALYNEAVKMIRRDPDPHAYDLSEYAICALGYLHTVCRIHEGVQLIMAWNNIENSIGLYGDYFPALYYARALFFYKTAKYKEAEICISETLIYLQNVQELSPVNFPGINTEICESRKETLIEYLNNLRTSIRKVSITGKEDVDNQVCGPHSSASEEKLTDKYFANTKLNIGFSSTRIEKVIKCDKEIQNAASITVKSTQTIQATRSVQDKAIQVDIAKTGTNLDENFAQVIDVLKDLKLNHNSLEAQITKLQIGKLEEKKDATVDQLTIQILKDQLQKLEEASAEKTRNFEVLKTILCEQSIGYLNLQELLINKNKEICDEMINSLYQFSRLVPAAQYLIHMECRRNSMEWQCALNEITLHKTNFEKHYANVVKTIRDGNYDNIPAASSFMKDVTLPKNSFLTSLQAFLCTSLGYNNGQGYSNGALMPPPMQSNFRSGGPPSFPPGYQQMPPPVLSEVDRAGTPNAPETKNRPSVRGNSSSTNCNQVVTPVTDSNSNDSADKTHTMKLNTNFKLQVSANKILPTADERVQKASEWVTSQETMNDNEDEQSSVKELKTGIEEQQSSKRSEKSINKLLERLKQMLPDIKEDTLLSVLHSVRSRNNGKLSGLSFAEIFNKVQGLLSVEKTG